LSEYPGDLRLLGLKDLSDTAAQHLAKILRKAGHGE
jgi:hypothetical protein